MLSVALDMLSVLLSTGADEPQLDGGGRTAGELPWDGDLAERAAKRRMLRRAPAFRSRSRGWLSLVETVAAPTAEAAAVVALVMPREGEEASSGCADLLARQQQVLCPAYRQGTTNNTQKYLNRPDSKCPLH